jgi:hypothetical protein
MKRKSMKKVEKLTSKVQSTIRLHPLISAWSILPKISKLPSACKSPKSPVAIKGQDQMLARSMILIPPVFRAPAS